MPPLIFWTTLLVAVLVVLVLWLTWLYTDERTRRLAAEAAAPRRYTPVIDRPAFAAAGTTWSTALRPPTAPTRIAIATRPPHPAEENTVIPTRRTRPRLVLATLVTLVLAGLAAGCWPQPAALSADTCGRPDGPVDVVIFGDSLAAMARPQVCERLAADGLRASYNAMGGTQLNHWTDAMANVPDGTPVVMELGTNDVTNDHSQVMLPDLDTALDTLAGASCLLVPDLNTTGGDLRGWPYDVRTRMFNDALYADLGHGTHPNLRVMAWNAIAAGHPEYLLGDLATPSDWVHYGGNPAPGPTDPSGNDRYATMIADAAVAATSGCV